MSLNEPRHEKTVFFCICENKDADQLRGNREADQRLCFRYIGSTIPQLSKSNDFKPLAIFCGCTAQFVSDLVENPEDQFSHNEAQLIIIELHSDKTSKAVYAPNKGMNQPVGLKKVCEQGRLDGCSG